MIGFIGGLAGLGNYAKRMADEKEARDLRQEELAFKREQRDEWRRNRDRVAAEQQRADSVRDQLSRQAQVGEMEEVDAADVDIETAKPTLPIDTRPTSSQIEAVAAAGVEQPGPPKELAAPRKVRVPITQDEFLRRKAKILQDNGFHEDADKVLMQAEKFAFGRSANQFAQIKGNAAGKPAAQVATEIARVYNRDPLPGKISRIEDIGGGRARITFTIAATGQTMVKEVRDTADLLDGMEAYYSPDTFAAVQNAKREAAIKLQAQRDEAAMKPHSVAPGASLVSGEGKLLYHNPKPEKGEGGGAGGGGGGAGAGGAGGPIDFMAGFDPKDAQDQATRLVDGQAAEMGEKLDSAERAKRINQAIFSLRSNYAQNMQREIAAREVVNVLRKSAADPARYASEYGKAVAAGLASNRRDE